MFYAATHGSYDIKTPKAVVPPYTLLFIAETPGDLCKVDLDDPIWWLMQPLTRRVLLSVLYGRPFNPDDEQRLALLREDSANVLMQFGLYIPGDKYLDRVLEIGAVSDDPTNIAHIMGFYSFGPPEFPGPGESGTLYSRSTYPEYTEVVGRKTVIKKGSPVILHDLREKLTTNVNSRVLISEFISSLPPAAMPRVIFITSCGSAMTIANRDKLIKEEGGLGHRNMMTYFPAVTHSRSSLSHSMLRPSSKYPGMVIPGLYKGGSPYWLAQTFPKQSGSGRRRRTQKVKRRLRRHTRRQR